MEQQKSFQVLEEKAAHALVRARAKTFHSGDKSVGTVRQRLQKRILVPSSDLSQDVIDLPIASDSDAVDQKPEIPRRIPGDSVKVIFVPPAVAEELASAQNVVCISGPSNFYVQPNSSEIAVEIPK